MTKEQYERVEFYVSQAVLALRAIPDCDKDASWGTWHDILYRYREWLIYHKEKPNERLGRMRIDL